MSLTTFTIVSALGTCNWHASLNGALGLVILIRAWHAAQNQRHDKALEDAITGAVYVATAMLLFSR